MTTEMVPLALFSSLVQLIEHHVFADTLLKVLPANLLRSPQNHFCFHVDRLIDDASHSFHHRLICPHDYATLLTLTHGSQCSDLRSLISFLHLSVTEWDTKDAYLLSGENFKAINVVNNAAEHDIKLATDFVDTTDTLVENDHNSNPYFLG